MRQNKLRNINSFPSLSATTQSWHRAIKISMRFRKSCFFIHFMVTVAVLFDYCVQKMVADAETKAEICLKNKFERWNQIPCGLFGNTYLEHFSKHFFYRECRSCGPARTGMARIKRTCGGFDCMRYSDMKIFEGAALQRWLIFFLLDHKFRLSFQKCDNEPDRLGLRRSHFSIFFAAE